jgi:hypothetical protein
MKSKLPRVAFLVVGLLAGCAGAPEQRPSGRPPIKITVVRETSTPVAVGTYADDFDCYGRKSVGLPDSPDIVLSASDKPWQTFEFSTAHFGATVIKTCQGIASFHTDAAHEYRIQFDEVSGDMCSMRVLSRPLGSQDAMVSVSVEPREKTVPFIDNAGPWCKPSEKFQGSSSYASPRH